MSRSAVWCCLLGLATCLARPAWAATPLLQLSPANPEVLKGSSLTLQAFLQPNADASVTDLSKHIRTWTSSAPAVASVDASGNVQGLSRGTTIITATLGALRGSTTVRVLAPVARLDPGNLVSTNYQLVGLTDQFGIFDIVSVGDVPLVITSIVITGAQAGDFQLVYSTPPVLPVSLPAGNGLQGQVYFDPSARGTRSAQITVIDNAGTQTLLLSGIGTTCLGPVFAADSRGLCADSDGDGLNDAWEQAGGIDFNNDGVVAPDEMVLANVDPIFPDGTANSHASADLSVKDVFVKYDWMELPDRQQPLACTVTPLSSGPPDFLNIFYPYHSDQCAFDEQCVNGTCRGHSDAPDGAALKMVIDAFAAHNIRLHLVRGHALPHSNVVAMGPPVIDCIADMASQNFSGAQAVDFFALKTANFSASYNDQSFSEAQLYPFFHYAIFAHRHSCDSTSDCAKSACLNPATGRRTLFNETGLSDQPGNDIIVSMGGFRDRLVTPLRLNQGGTFMHELGHNLGLNHGGPLFVNGVPTDLSQVSLNYKPNYLSVMNYNHQALGISTASPTCAADDYACKTTPVSVRLDYSSFAGGVAPNTLDENNGSEAAGINVGSNDIAYTWCSGAQTGIPGNGPVDFNCDGNRTETWCAFGCDITPGLELNKDPAGRGQIPNGTPGSGDILLPFEDWPNLIFDFHNQPTFNDGAPAFTLGGPEPTVDDLVQPHSVPASPSPRPSTPASRRCPAGACCVKSGR